MLLKEMLLKRFVRWAVNLHLIPGQEDIIFPRSKMGRYVDLIDRQSNETVHLVPTVISQA